jgi:gliding motility-associated-like protein
VSILFIFVSVLGFSQCPTPVSQVVKKVTCFGGSDGRVTFIPNCSDCSVKNSEGGNTTTMSNLKAGVYSAVFTHNESGCSMIMVASVEEPDDVYGSISSSDVTCGGSPNGTATVTPAGGNGTYSYTWNPGSGGAHRTGLSAGTYNVTITSGNCPSERLTTQIGTVPNTLYVTAKSTPENCVGSNDGTLDADAFNGTQPYNYSWSNGSGNEDVNGVGQGNYTINVTDAAGCTASSSVAVGRKSTTNVSSSITGTHVSCFEGSDGSINLSPAGGTQPYTYTWVNSDYVVVTTQDLNNITASKYDVTVSDLNGCTATNTFTVNEPTKLVSSITSKKNVSCYGGNDGEINLTASGGTPTYSYVWVNKQGTYNSTVPDPQNLYAGEYFVTITDSKGCETYNQVEITQPEAPIALEIEETIDVLCFGENTGFIDLVVTGGTPTYSYDWSDGSSDEDADSLIAGFYRVTVTDVLGCFDTISASIYQPQAPLTVTNQITDVLCHGDTTGDIILTPAGGTFPYYYKWENSTFLLSDINKDLISYAADTYVVTITDTNFCFINDTFIITQPPKLYSRLDEVHILCHGDNTGEINTTITGGVPPYTYLWNFGATDEDLLNLYSGFYSVTATDSHACTITDTVTLVQPLYPLSSFHHFDIPTCNGYDDGKLEFNVEGGTYPYDYVWSRGDTVNNIYDITAGLYEVTVTDHHKCILLDSIVVGEPEEISITAKIKAVSCYNARDGIIDLTVEGSWPGYTYDWINSTYEVSADVPDLINYPGDTYFVSVTDSLGCTNSASFDLYEPEILTAELDKKDITCHGDNDGQIEVEVFGGNEGGNFFAWSNSDSTQGILYTTQNVYDLAPDTYTVVISDTAGCDTTYWDVVVEPDPIVFDHKLASQSCRDLIDGWIELFPRGGWGSYYYDWDNGVTIALNDSIAGNTFYTVTVTDFGSCSKDTTIELPLNDAPCLQNIPTAITPEGDGYNDTWIIENVELYPQIEIIVFNKWGRQVFESTGEYIPWDGTYKNSKLPAGTYYYSIKISEESVDKYTGPITIVR